MCSTRNQAEFKNLHENLITNGRKKPQLQGYYVKQVEIHHFQSHGTTFLYTLRNL